MPLYQDAVAEKMAYVLEHYEASFFVAGDQEQVDKVLEIQDKVKGIKHIVYHDPRGLRKYDHARMHSMRDMQAKGRAANKRFAAELQKRQENQPH